MRRIIFFAAALMLTLSVTAQNKMLSSKQLMTRGLYPQATMRGFQFVGNTDQIAYVQDTVLYMGNPGKTKARLTLGALNKVLVASGEESLSYFPYCKILNDKELRFNAAGKVLLYNMAKKTLSVIAKYPTQDAQHLDMDLSCRIIYPKRNEDCAYYHLTSVGAKHSGDIQSIPEMTGTAEYIELTLPELEAAGAQYAVFTCNAYSTGALSPNLVVGWMNSAYPMKVSETDGVAYDPSCVQHSVRISEGNLSKGLVFGVLDVVKREIIWLEMPYSAQTMRSLSTTSVKALLKRLEEKLSIGDLLKMKAEAQSLTLVSTAGEADASYTYKWALNPAEVSRLLASEIH